MIYSPPWNHFLFFCQRTLFNIIRRNLYTGKKERKKSRHRGLVLVETKRETTTWVQYRLKSTARTFEWEWSIASTNEKHRRAAHKISVFSYKKNFRIFYRVSYRVSLTCNETQTTFFRSKLDRIKKIIYIDILIPAYIDVAMLNIWIFWYRKLLKKNSPPTRNSDQRAKKTQKFINLTAG